MWELGESVELGALGSRVQGAGQYEPWKHTLKILKPKRQTPKPQIDLILLSPERRSFKGKGSRRKPWGLRLRCGNQGWAPGLSAGFYFRFPFLFPIRFPLSISFSSLSPLSVSSFAQGLFLHLPCLLAGEHWNLVPFTLPPFPSLAPFLMSSLFHSPLSCFPFSPFPFPLFPIISPSNHWPCPFFQRQIQVLEPMRPLRAWI